MTLDTNMSDAERLDQLILEKAKSFGRHLSISLTRRCPLQCAHCIVESGPKFTRASDLPEKAVKAVVDGLRHIPEIRQLSLTGGEPFLRTDIISRISTAAAECDIRTGAVTSGSWAASTQKANRVLQELRHLSHITISWDTYHREFLPERNVVNAFAAAREQGRTATVRVSVPQILDKCHEDHLARARELFGTAVHTQELVNFGRAQTISFRNLSSPSVPVLPCLSSGPHVTDTGRVLPCCSTLTDHTLPDGHPLVLGSLNESTLRTVWTAARSNYLLTQIRMWGFVDIHRMLMDKGIPVRITDFSPEGQCSLCAEMMNDPEVVNAIEEWISRLETKIAITAGSIRLFDEYDLFDRFRIEAKEYLKSAPEFSGVCE